MSAAETLRTLAAGKRPTSGLLHTARLEAFGAEVYGEEAIVESFRYAPFELSNAAIAVEASGHVAIFDGDTALIADLSGENIARIWRLGAGAAVSGEPGVSVAFDPDLAQARGAVFVAATDHPVLAAEALEWVERTGRAVVCDDPNPYRARAFALRAFGTMEQGAALFAVYRLVGEPKRSSGFSLAAAHWSSGDFQIVRDAAGESAVIERAWTPNAAGPASHAVPKGLNP